MTGRAFRGRIRRSKPSSRSAREDGEPGCSCGALSELAELTTVHQEQPLGLGHAVLMGQAGGRRRAVRRAPARRRDRRRSAGAAAHGRALRGARTVPLLLVERVPRDAVNRYGIIDATLRSRPGVFQVRGLVEKPDPADGTLRPGHRGALHPDSGHCSPCWKRTGAGAGGEIQLTDGLREPAGAASASTPASWPACATTPATGWGFSRLRSTLRSSARTSAPAAARLPDRTLE